MFKIGDFSRISQVSVKTLRYYDEIGLLRPAPAGRSICAARVTTTTPRRLWDTRNTWRTLQTPA